jgi:cobyrinic acid a,c-diamide synthase
LLLEHWSATAAEWLDLERLLSIARSTAPILLDESSAPASHIDVSGCRIGVAHDAAFHFYYADNLRRLEEAGAELVRFSPIHDARLPAVDGVYLGGGYPELHATALAANVEMRASLKAFAKRGGPIYAECGGLMYLTTAIETISGQRHQMVGLLPGVAVMHGKLRALGYVETETQARTILGPAGTRFRGHQFRYSELTWHAADTPIALAYSLRRRRDEQVSREGYSVGNVLASYVHAHWASNPRVATELVASCARFAAEQRS